MTPWNFFTGMYTEELVDADTSINIVSIQSRIGQYGHTAAAVTRTVSIIIATFSRNRTRVIRSICQNRNTSASLFLYSWSITCKASEPDLETVRVSYAI